MRRIRTTVKGVCLGLAILHGASQAGAGELAYIGTLGSDFWQPGPQQLTENQPQGIYIARFDEKTGRFSLVGVGIELQRSNFLMTHPTLPVIYSVAESAGGSKANSDIYSLGLDPASGKLHVIDKVDAQGIDATALELDAASGTLFSANHGSGDVSALPLLPDGSVGSVASVQKDYGSGPTPRQHGPMAHDVALDPTHAYLLVADFGADRIFVYHFDPKTRALTPAQTPFEPLPAGSGPRHIAFHPNGRFLFLVTELTAELRSYRWDAKEGRLQLVQAVETFPANAGEEKSGGEVKVSRDGHFVYVSLRGDQNSIVVYAVNREAGTLKEIQRVSAEGKTPWSFSFDRTRHWLIVANAGSNSVAVFKVNPATGKLTATGESVSIPKPSNVTFYPN
jgi:6-phosphogluconolactonase